MVAIKFNYLKNENKPVSKKGGWYDIPLPYDIYFEAGEVVKIVFDLRLKMPYGYEAIIQPRSSTLERTGLISSGFGVIEDTYCGPDDYIGYRFYATKDGFVSAGSCLVQMRFQEKMRDYEILRAEDDEFSSNKNRGGFGSTDNHKSLTEIKAGLAKNGKAHLSSMCGEQVTHINKLDWEPEQETEYQQGFSCGFDEGHTDGYEEGFRDGYDMATADGFATAFATWDINVIKKAQTAKHGDNCPFNLWNYTGSAQCICLPVENDSCGYTINENCPFRNKAKYV